MRKWMVVVGAALLLAGCGVEQGLTIHPDGTVDVSAAIFAERQDAEASDSGTEASDSGTSERSSSIHPDIEEGIRRAMASRFGLTNVQVTRTEEGNRTVVRVTVPKQSFEDAVELLTTVPFTTDLPLFAVAELKKVPSVSGVRYVFFGETIPPHRGAAGWEFRLTFPEPVDPRSIIADSSQYRISPDGRTVVWSLPAAVSAQIGASSQPRRSPGYWAGVAVAAAVAAGVVRARFPHWRHAWRRRQLRVLMHEAAAARERETRRSDPPEAPTGGSPPPTAG